MTNFESLVRFGARDLLVIGWAVRLSFNWASVVSTLWELSWMIVATVTVSLNVTVGRWYVFEDGIVRFSLFLDLLCS